MFLKQKRIKTIPVFGLIGLVLIAIFWPLNWFLAGPRTHVLFFPLWVGYILTVEGLTLARGGTPFLRRSLTGFVVLFVVSAPAWWLFELINLRTGNWHYEGRALFTDLEYAIYATISFSIVIPAVFCTANLLRTFRWPGRFRNRRKLGMSTTLARVFFLIGIVMLSLVIIWPKYFYPFMWGSLFFLLDPINHILGKPTILSSLSRGDWTLFATLPAAALTCGFFWEIWNLYSYPKWTYDIPFVNFLHVFEMPLLGYIGYLPFGLELYSLYHLVVPRRLELSRILGD